MFSAQTALHLTSDAAAMRLHSLRSAHAHSAYTVERSSLGQQEFLRVTELNPASIHLLGHTWAFFQLPLEN